MIADIKNNLTYIVKGSFWITGGKIVLAIISLVTMAAFANLLPQETYGLYQFVLSIGSTLSILSLPGIYNAIIRASAQGNGGVFREAATTQLRWSLVGSAVLCCISVWYGLQGNVVFSGIFLISALFFPLRFTFPVFETYWNGIKRFDTENILKIISAIGTSGITILALVLTDNIVVIITTLFISYALFDGALFFYTRKKSSAVVSKTVISETISFGKHLTLMRSISVIASNIDKIIVWKFLGPIQVAVYSFAQLPIHKALGMLPITTLALPQFSQYGVANRKKTIVSRVAMLLPPTALFALALFLISPLLYQVIFPGYADSVVYFQALTVLVAIFPLLLFETGLEAERQQRALYIIRTASPVIKIILFLLLVTQFGIWGMIISIILGELCKYALAFYFFIKMTPQINE